MTPPSVPLHKLSPKTFFSQTLHKCVGDCTTMGADCGVFNLTFERILCRFVHILAKLKAINSAQSFKQLSMLNVSRHFVIHSDKVAEVWKIRLSAIFQFVNNLLRQFLTQMWSQFFDGKLIEWQQFFIQSRRNWLRHGVRNHAQDLSNIIHLSFDLIAVDNNLNGGHGSVGCGRRQWCAVGGIMTHQNRPPPATLCHLANCPSGAF